MAGINQKNPTMKNLSSLKKISYNNKVCHFIAVKQCNSVYILTLINSGGERINNKMIVQ